MSNLKTAVDLIKSGQRAEAREILVEILQANPDSEEVWLWMTKTGISNQQKVKCLKRVLEINPDNDKAEELLKKLEGRGEKSLLLDEFSDIPEPTPKPSQPEKIRAVLTEADGIRFGFGFLISIVLFAIVSTPFVCFLSFFVPGLFL